MDASPTKAAGMPERTPSRPLRVVVAGGTGTIGRATVAELVMRGHRVLCLTRPDRPSSSGLPAGIDTCRFDPVGPDDNHRPWLEGGAVDAVISCMASRSGVPADAWAVDHAANLALLTAAQRAGAAHFVLLSAICVQRPLLAFQHAKLAFEAELMASGLAWSIVRPTAFFKSLSGQIGRVLAGKPFLLFGDGTLTACKPISDRDLARYLVDCLSNPDRTNRLLPIGGPGPARTPRDQGMALFDLLGMPPRFRSVPPGLLSAIASGLGMAGRMFPALAAKAELARIGHYYATQSMLVLNPQTGRYDADATPETGTDTLIDHYRSIIEGRASADRGDHAVF
ncbi:NAD(P)H-binding protein [Sphingomonas sp. BGYR3]|uniref:NAD(P)H-binding protein n=1 Tax=Sphingomonas sp. BGYR3 TaxID=2975483 RepID=UPI00325FAE27